MKRTLQFIDSFGRTDRGRIGGNHKGIKWQHFVSGATTKTSRNSKLHLQHSLIREATLVIRQIRLKSASANCFAIVPVLSPHLSRERIDESTEGKSFSSGGFASSYEFTMIHRLAFLFWCVLAREGDTLVPYKNRQEIHCDPRIAAASCADFLKTWAEVDADSNLSRGRIELQMTKQPHSMYASYADLSTPSRRQNL